MKNILKERFLLLAIFTLFSFWSCAQTAFQSGYFINESGQRVDCLIENIDWKNNPTSFKYMLTQGSESKKAEINDVKEFGITNISRYVRAKVNIDRSESVLVTQTYDKNPVFKEELLFLKVLIEGKASLFLYEEGNLTRYFYKTDGEIKQLVYKEYLTEEKRIMKNYFFRQQLYNDLRTASLTASDLKKVNYNHRHLERVFVAYNVSQKSSYVDFEPPQKRDRFNFSIRPGVNSSSLSVDNSYTGVESSLGKKLGFRLGLEAEFILPFNNNKWGVMVEPTYQSYDDSKTTDDTSISGGTRTTTVDYKSIELPIGFRHYFFLNGDSKIFLNVAVVIDFCMDSNIEFSRANGTPLGTLDMKSRPNYAFGAGYKLKNKYSLEIRYFTNRNVTSDYVSWDSEYKTLSATIGYSF